MEKTLDGFTDVFQPGPRSLIPATSTTGELWQAEVRLRTPPPLLAFNANSKLAFFLLCFLHIVSNLYCSLESGTLICPVDLFHALVEDAPT